MYSRGRRYSTKRRTVKRRFGRRRIGRRKTFLSRYTNRVTKSVIKPGIVSDKTYLKLTKSSPFSFNGITGAIGYVSFLGNSFINGAGSNSLADLDAPAGLQVWSQFYQNYRIVGTKVTVAFANVSAETPIVGLLASKGPYTPDISNITDQPYCKWKYISQQGGMDRATLSMYMKTQKMFSQKVSQEDNYQGSMSYDDFSNTLTCSSPAELYNWYLFGASPSGGTCTINGFVTVTYYVYLEDRHAQISKVPTAS